MSIASGYLPILIMIVLGIILAGLFSIIGLFLGPKLRGEAKEIPFESGFLRDGMEGQRYDVKNQKNQRSHVKLDIISLTVHTVSQKTGFKRYFLYFSSQFRSQKKAYYAE